MKKGKHIIIFLAGSLFVTLLPARDLSSQDNIGRLFMTPEERRTLDILRNQEDRTTITVPSLAIEDDPDEVLDEQITGITVDGIVYRKNGKSTAWVNDGNTYEGDLSTQYLDINPEHISPGGVKIKVKNNDKSRLIRMETGQTYDPVKDEVVDPVKYK